MAEFDVEKLDPDAVLGDANEVLDGLVILARSGNRAAFANAATDLGMNLERTLAVLCVAVNRLAAKSDG